MALLLERRAQPAVLSHSFRRPIDVAAHGFVEEEGSVAWYQSNGCERDIQKVIKMTAGDRRDSRANLMVRSEHSRTLVLHHAECLEHQTKSSADWEAPDRVKAILKRVSAPPEASQGIFPHEIELSQEFDRASLDLLSRIHSTEYLSFVNGLSKELERKLEDSGQSLIDSESPSVVPFTPMVQRTMIKVDESDVKDLANSDTSFSVGSLRAARRAAGAVQHAVDWYVT